MLRCFSLVRPHSRIETPTKPWAMGPFLPQPQIPRGEHPSQIQIHPLRVLIADSHELVREGVASMLERDAGISVVLQAHCGRDVLRLAQEHHPDIVVIGLAMPDMSGEEIVAGVRTTSPDTPILVLTHRASASFLLPLLRAGVKGYILKTTAFGEFARAIRVVANGGTYVDPNLSDAFDSRLGNLKRGTTGLTRRETDVVVLLAWGYSNSQVASRLKISTKTVEFYRARAVAKLNIKGRTGIIRHAVGQGWLTEANMPPT